MFQIMRLIIFGCISFDFSRVAEVTGDFIRGLEQNATHKFTDGKNDTIINSEIEWNTGNTNMDELLNFNDGSGEPETTSTVHYLSPYNGGIEHGTSDESIKEVRDEELAPVAVTKSPTTTDVASGEAWLETSVVNNKVSIEDSLFVSNGSHILSLSLDNQDSTIVTSSSKGLIVGLAADVTEKILFWSVVGGPAAGIYQSNLQGQHKKHIIQDVQGCHGITVDWISYHIYYTDEHSRSIHVVEYDGMNDVALIKTSLSLPRGIVVDPIQGLLFWGDQGTEHIERSRLDGSEREVIISSGVVWPNQLALNLQKRMLYWVDADNRCLESCDYNGMNRKRDDQLQEALYGAPLYGLVVQDNTAFISTWYEGAVYAAHLDAKGNLNQTNVIMEFTTSEMYSLVSMASSTQPAGINECRGRCSHLCLRSNKDVQCFCPTKGSLILMEDQETCQDAKEMILFTDKDRGEVGLLSLLGELHVWETSSMPVAIGFDYQSHDIYWSDARDNIIYRKNIRTRKEKEIFLDASHGIGTVDGMVIDYLRRRLYFSNLGSLTSLEDNAVYSWQRIEMIYLDGSDHRTIVSNVDKPRALTLDLDNNQLYYTDWGKSPGVIRCDLDGYNCHYLIDESGIENPNGLYLHNDMLYITDSNYNRQTRSPSLIVYNLTSDSWNRSVPILSESQMFSIPFGISGKARHLFITDWLSPDSETGLVWDYDSDLGVASILARNLNNPTDLAYIDLQLDIQASQVKDSCWNNTCSHTCIPTSRQNFRCSCPQDSALILDLDGFNCKAPSTFLLFCDLNTIKLLPLGYHSDLEDHVVTLHYGRSDANYVAIAFDDIFNVVFWSDLTSKSIFRKDLNKTGTPTTFLQSAYTIDGMAIDVHVNRRLYWVGYDDTEMSGVLAVTSLEGHQAMYKELITGLDMPRAIALDLDNKFIYWTEYRPTLDSPRVGRAFLDGSSQTTLIGENLKWPNALHIAPNQLYVADGSHHTIDVYDLDGQNRNQLIFLSGSMDHIYGLDIVDHVVYYSDWVSHSIQMSNLRTGQIDTLATDLMRPNGIVVVTPQFYTAMNACNEGRHLCSHICIPIPGSYHCACPDGMSLEKNGQNCISGDDLWEVVDDFQCDYRCHDNAYCSRLHHNGVFLCVCIRGYHGDGEQSCQECPVDFYKSQESNTTCLPCPMGSSTNMVTGSSSCVCDDPAQVFKDGLCQNQDIESNAMDMYFEEVASSPRFINCPSGETIILYLGGSHSYSTLNIPLYAVDKTGKRLQVHGTHDPPPGSKFEWTGDIHYVRYDAEDDLGYVIHCEFMVKVIDKQAPVFTGCPNKEGIETNTTGLYQKVYWSDPEAYDNVAVVQYIYPTTPSGRRFPVGHWPISYRAVDEEGNKAWCNFSVTVKHIDIPCNLNHVLDSGHGSMECHLNPNGYYCQTQCNTKSHALNPIPDYHGVQCNKNGLWERDLPADYVTRACLKKSTRRRLERRLQLWLAGPCHEMDMIEHGRLVAALVGELDTRGLCSPYRFGRLYDVCDPTLFEVKCNNRSSKENSTRRVRRSTDGSFRVQIIVQANTSIEEQVAAEAAINDTVCKIQHTFDTGINFNTSNAMYHSVQGWVQVEPLVLLCQRGTIHLLSDCLLCPRGTFSDIAKMRCTDCPKGSYQDEEGAEYCKVCPKDATSIKSATASSMCVSPPSALTRMIAPSNRPVLATVLTVCGMVIIILVLCVLGIHRKHLHHHYKLTPDHIGGLQYENPYVIRVAKSRATPLGNVSLDCEGKEINSERSIQSYRHRSSWNTYKLSLLAVNPLIAAILKRKCQLLDVLKRRQTNSVSSTKHSPDDEIKLEVHPFIVKCNHEQLSKI